MALAPIGRITTPAPQGWVDSNLSSDLQDHTFEPFSPDGYEEPIYVDGSIRKTVYNVSRAYRRTGNYARTWFDDYYERIHINPTALELGRLVSAQVRTVRVWNAYLTPKTLVSTPMEGGGGIEIVAPGSLPMTVGATQELEWQLNVSTDGPAQLNAVWTFNFAGLEPLIVTITGDRVVPWTFAPDWREGVTERLSWLTSVVTSPRRAEQRRALRQAPERTFEARSLLDGPERTAFDLATYSWGGRTWAMPIWPDIVWLATPVALGATFIACSTAQRDFVAGGLALLRPGDAQDVLTFEVVEVDSIVSSGLNLSRATLRAWPRGSRLYPLRLAELTQQPKVRRITDATIEARYQFEVVEPCDWPAALPTTIYRGFPVLERQSDETDGLDNDWERAQLVIHNPTGFKLRTETASVPATLNQHRWVLNGRAEQAAFRSLLYGFQGRLKEAWVPTFASDLSLISTSGNTLVVQAVDYARFGLGRVGRKDLLIELLDGTRFYRRVDAASLVGNGTENLALDTSLGMALVPAQVRRISFMALCRLDVDSIEIEHLTDADGTARAALVFRSIRDDV